MPPLGPLLGIFHAPLPGIFRVPITPACAEPCAGTITIEFPGRALLSIEGAADPAVIRAVLESLAR